MFVAWSQTIISLYQIKLIVCLNDDQIIYLLRPWVYVFRLQDFRAAGEDIKNWLNEVVGVPYPTGAAS